MGLPIEEIFPLRYRAKGTSAGTVSNWTWNAVISKIAPLILADINYYTYLIFAGMCLAMALFALVFCPETRGLTLEQVEVIFGHSKEKGKGADKSERQSSEDDLELHELEDPSSRSDASPRPESGKAVKQNN